MERLYATKLLMVFVLLGLVVTALIVPFSDKLPLYFPTGPGARALVKL